MPMLKAPRTTTRRQRLRQDVVVTGFSRLTEFYESYRTAIIGAIAAVVVLVLVAIGWSFYQSRQQAQATELLGGIVRSYEEGNFRQALDGTAESPGLLEIADGYGGTEAGNLAAFYAADALYQLGEKEEALGYFRAYDKGDDLIGASAYAGEAAVYEDQGNASAAAAAYEDAAAAFDSPLTTPQYLMRAALNHEAAGNSDRARNLLEQIQEEYPESQAAQNVAIYLARLGA